MSLSLTPTPFHPPGLVACTHPHHASSETLSNLLWDSGTVFRDTESYAVVWGERERERDRETRGSGTEQVLMQCHTGDCCTTASSGPI